MLELAFFLFLGVLSCFVDMSESLALSVNKVRAGESLGGVLLVLGYPFYWLILLDAFQRD